MAKASAEATKAIDAQIDALRKAETAGKPEQAEIVKAAIGEAGGVDDVTNATRAAMLAESPEVAAATKNANATADANATAAANPANPIAQLKALVAIRKADRERDEATAKVEQLTKALVAKAGQGDADAIRELDRLNPGGSFGQALPESIKAQDAEVQAVDDQGAAMHKAGVKRRKNDALVDTLNTEGAANEAATRKDEFEANRKSLLLPQNDVAESTPEYQANQARAEIQRGQANLGDLQRQADDIAGRMQVGAAMGFDVGPLQQTLQNIAAMYEQQQRAFVNAQLKINDLARGSRVSQRTVRSNLNRNRP